ncbi:MAG: acetolactate synthase small subunit [Kiritimatiellia bacterium]
MNNIINCLVENEPGVLARIVSMISGRGYNIETLNVAPTQDRKVSKMTMVVPGDAHIIEQVTHQLTKLVNVIEVVNMTNQRHMNRELILVRVASRDHVNRSEIVDLATLFNAKVIAVQEDSVTVQMVGNQDHVSDFLHLFEPYQIMDLSRSGVIAVGREVAAAKPVS